jgi:hypothetical protein
VRKLPGRSDEVTEGCRPDPLTSDVNDGLTKSRPANEHGNTEVMRLWLNFRSEELPHE